MFHCKQSADPKKNGSKPPALQPSAQSSFVPAEEDFISLNFSDITNDFVQLSMTTIDVFRVSRYHHAHRSLLDSNSSSEFLRFIDFIFVRAAAKKKM